MALTLPLTASLMFASPFSDVSSFHVRFSPDARRALVPDFSESGTFHVAAIVRPLPRLSVRPVMPCVGTPVTLVRSYFHLTSRSMPADFAV